jgi:hypothetical protein
MRRITVVVLLLFPSVPNAQLVPNVSLGARLTGESRSDVSGEIEYFKGTDPTPDYRESVGPGLGLGAEAGYQLHRRVHLSVGFDMTRHSTEREAVALSKTLFQLSSVARMFVGPDGSVLQPYLAAGFSLRNLRDGDAAASPWPRTESIFGDGVILGGGVQRPLRENLSIDAGLQFAWTSYQSLTAEGRFEKETGAERSFLPRAHVGVVYRSPAPVLPAGADVGRAPREGDRVRVHIGDRSAGGDVLVMSADSMILQTRRGGRLEQLAVPVACIDALDASVGTRSRFGAAASGAIRGIVLGTAAYFLLKRAGESRFPDEQRRVAVLFVAPSAIAGAIFGSGGSRDLWTPRPLAWQTRGASRAEMSCPRLP